MDIAARKIQVVRVLKERLLLRFHMSLILIGTALVGLLASKLLLMSHVTNMVVRYPLAVSASYLAFFGFVKLWLSYITSSDEDSSPDSPDVIDLISHAASDTPVPSPPVFGGGGGGSFGGGGASGSFDVGAADAPPARFTTIFDSLDADGAGEAAGDTVSGLAEEGGCLLIILGILLAIVFGAGLYLVYDAPFILSEAAFEFILSAGLIKSMRKIDSAEWTGSILRTTWKPFLAALSLSLFAAVIIHSLFPHADKLWEIFGNEGH